MQSLISFAAAFAPALIAAGADADLAPNPLAPALDGLVQCYQPDRAGHTCQSIATYRQNRDGTWLNTATVLPDPSQPMTMVTTSVVMVRDGAVCGVVRANDLLAAKLMFFGQPVAADRAASVLHQIVLAMTGVIDREVCTRYAAVPGGLVASGQVTGTAIVFPQQAVIWVRPDAGYTVLPPGMHLNGG